MKKPRIYIDKLGFPKEKILELMEKYEVIEFKVSDRVTTKDIVERGD